MDFLGIKYISRSFSYQFRNDKLEAEAKHSKTVSIINAGEVLTNMLEAVARTQANDIRKQEMLSIFQLSSMIGLENFLYSI